MINSFDESMLVIKNSKIIFSNSNAKSMMKFLNQNKIGDDVDDIFEKKKFFVFKETNNNKVDESKLPED